MKSVKAIINIGYNEGYGKNDKMTLDEFSLFLQDFIANNYESIGEYISFIVTPAMTVYNTDWGCHNGGEPMMLLTASANPQFVKNIDLWKIHVEEYARMLKSVLKQSTVFMEFVETDTVYLK